MTDARGFAGNSESETTKGLKRAGPMLENVSESAAACLLTMAQGNVLAFGLGHWLVASQTGLLAGTVATIALWLSGGRGRWAVAGALGLATAVADYAIHPSGFGPAIAEPLVTGFAAAGLSLLVATTRDQWVRRRSGPEHRVG